MSGEAVTSTRPERRVPPWQVALVVMLVLLVALLLAWDWNWFKGPIERRVATTTGREFRIEGPLDVDLGRIVIVRVEDMWLANTAWSLAPEMARVDLLRVEIPFWPLLRGERTLRRVDVVRPAVLLERNRAGAANWQFRHGQQRAPRPAKSWAFGELRVHDGRLDVRDAPLGTDLRLTIDSSTPQAGDDSVRLLVRGTGRYRGHPFQLVGTADSPVELLERADAAYRVDFSARAGSTRGRAHGALRVPLNPEKFVVNAELRGNDLGDLYPLVGLAVPSIAALPHRGSLRTRRADADATRHAGQDRRQRRRRFGRHRPERRQATAHGGRDLDAPRPRRPRRADRPAALDRRGRVGVTRAARRGRTTRRGPAPAARQGIRPAQTRLRECRHASARAGRRRRQVADRFARVPTALARLDRQGRIRSSSVSRAARLRATCSSTRGGRRSRPARTSPSAASISRRCGRT